MERCCNGVALTGLRDSRWPCWVFFFRLMLTSWEWNNSIDLISYDLAQERSNQGFMKDSMDVHVYP